MAYHLGGSNFDANRVERLVSKPLTTVGEKHTASDRPQEKKKKIILMITQRRSHLNAMWQNSVYLIRAVHRV